MKLRALANLDLDVVASFGDLDTEVSGISCDSRRVVPGDLFAALRGARSDGASFIAAALQRGAVAVLAERARPAAEELPQELPWLQTRAVRPAMGRAAAAVYDYPARALRVVGVTGTNGKTTVATLVASLSAGLGGPSGFIGTTGYRIGDREIPAARTTPEAPELQRLLAEMRDAGVALAAIEVSSHALTLERTAGLELDVAIFTNLSRDHLDFHRDMDDYFAAKRRIFALLEPRGWAVVNIDDERGSAIAADLAAGTRLLTFAIENPLATVRPLSYELAANGIRARLQTPAGELDLESALVGRVNLENLLAAAAAGIALGVAPDRVAAALASVKRIAGRLEPVDAGQPFTVLVDYAHSDDALAKLLGTARTLCATHSSPLTLSLSKGASSGRLIVVFGCGGGRDRGKRPLMGRAASALADLVFITSDNPRHEEPGAILAEVAAGCTRANYEIVEDRAAAIAAALAAAGSGDVVAIAGKGHETTQEIGGASIPFDDRAVALAWLAKHYGGSARG